MSVLFKQSLKREEERFKMEAIFHGAQIDDLSKEKKSGKENTFTFKDPKEYDYLSFEQKKELTKKMFLGD